MDDRSDHPGTRRAATDSSGAGGEYRTWAPESSVTRGELASLCELSLDLLCILDSSRRFVAVNPAFTEVLGWSDTDLVGLPFADGVHPDERASAQGKLDAAELDDARDSTRQRDESRVASQARRIHFAARIRQASGGYVGFVWTARARAGRYHLVGRRTPLQAASGASQRPPSADLADLADAAGHAKTEFLASMNHELRTPLNAIVGYTELLSGETGLLARQREALAAIKRSSQHLLLLISDVLDFARLDAHKLTLTPQEFLLSGFLDNFIELFEARAKKRGISFAVQATTPLPAAVCADETRLRQVLLNLLSNAVKFTERGGVVLRAAYHGGILRFEVEDTGIGIPDESLDAIFHPFEQLPSVGRVAEGTGLGLSLCRHLVELMGGVLQVESEVGNGSRFWFEIEPSRVLRWPEKPVGHTVITGYHGPERCVLVVDDQPQVRAFISRLLGAVGVRVIEANDGRQAVATVVRERPELVIMDLVMPELDGFEAARRIRALGEIGAIPIVAATSASPLVEMGVEAARVGDQPVYDAFLNKPVAVDDLYDLVAEHLQLEWQFGLAHSGEWSVPDIELPGEQVAGAQPEGHGSSAGAASDAPEAAEDNDDALGADLQAGVVTLPVEQLQAIYDAATIGDIREILSILERAGHRPDGAAASGSSFEPLADQIHRLARAFRSRHIKELLHPYLS